MGSLQRHRARFQRADDPDRLPPCAGSTAVETLLRRALIAKPDDYAIPFQTADAPGLAATVAIGFDTAAGIEQSPEHAVRVAVLKAAIPALRATGHEGNHLVHRPEAARGNPAEVASGA